MSMVFMRAHQTKNGIKAHIIIVHIIITCATSFYYLLFDFCIIYYISSFRSFLYFAKVGICNGFLLQNANRLCCSNDNDPDRNETLVLTHKKKANNFKRIFWYKRFELANKGAYLIQTRRRFYFIFFFPFSKMWQFSIWQY